MIYNEFKYKVFHIVSVSRSFLGNLRDFERVVEVTMSISRLFTILGDANVKDNMTALNMASREVMKKAQIIPCPAMSNLGLALYGVRDESNVFIFAGVTQLILSTEECNTIYATIDPVLASIREELAR